MTFEDSSGIRADLYVLHERLYFGVEQPEHIYLLLSSEPKGSTHRVTGTVPSDHDRVVWVKAFIVLLLLATVPCVSQLSSPFCSLVQRRISYLWKIFEDKYKTSASPRLKNRCFPPAYAGIFPYTLWTLDLLSHKIWRMKQKCNYGLLVRGLR